MAGFPPQCRKKRDGHWEVARGEGEGCGPRFSSFCQFSQNNLVTKGTDPPGPSHKQPPQPHLPSRFQENRWKPVTLGFSERSGAHLQSQVGQPTENTISKAAGGVCCKLASPASGIRELLQTAGKRGLQTHLTSKYSQPPEKDRPEGEMRSLGMRPWRKAFPRGAARPSLSSFPGGPLASEPSEGRGSAKSSSQTRPAKHCCSNYSRIRVTFSSIYEGPTLCPRVRGAAGAAVTPRAGLRPGGPAPLRLGRTTRTARRGGAAVQELEIQTDENVEPNDLWVGWDCRDEVSASLLSDSRRCFCYTRRMARTYDSCAVAWTGITFSSSESALIQIFTMCIDF